VQLACCLIACAQTLVWPDHEARRWEPKRLRWRLFHCPTELVRAAVWVWVFVRFNRAHPWAQLLAEALARMRAMPNPA
jgi:hypothetical protein